MIQISNTSNFEETKIFKLYYKPNLHSHVTNKLHYGIFEIAPTGTECGSNGSHFGSDERLFT